MSTFYQPNGSLGVSGQNTAKTACVFVVLCLFLLCNVVAAQSFSIRELEVARQGPDLKFPESGKEISFFSPLEMAIYKPSGEGPFPAIVMVHSCGGLRQEIRDWTKIALERGFVVFVTDSLGQRGLKNGCYPPNAVLSPRGANDVLQARAHLRNFSYVDQSRVALVGFSWGAMAGLLVSGKAVAEQLATVRFDAVVGFYPVCYRPALGGRSEFEFLRSDVDKPLLVLMGDQDNEAPPVHCISRLEALKQKGAPVEWHVYPETTHCWDCSTLHGLSKIDMNGVRVNYRYNKRISEDSVNRLFLFLANHLGGEK